ncbi:MAG: hypothetical protein ACI9P5_002779, partial [Saprospiraceae bacterium]
DRAFLAEAALLLQKPLWLRIIMCALLDFIMCELLDSCFLQKPGSGCLRQSVSCRSRSALAEAALVTNYYVCVVGFYYV